MKIRCALLVFLISAISVLAQEEIDLNSISEASPPPTAPRGAPLKIQFYGDFDVDFSVAKDFSGNPAFSFKQNHQALLLEAAGSTNLTILADVLHPGDIFEMGIAIGKTRLTIGRILIPFGNFEFHHIYGGRQDDEGIFFPKLWSDYGLRWQFSLFDNLGMEVFASNGFDPSGFGVEVASPRFYSVGMLDNNTPKAFGGRVRYDFTSKFWGSVSVYQDFYDTDLEHSVTFAGGDGGVRFGRWGVKAGVVFGVISGPDVSEFYRWADYGEVKYSITDELAVRLRGGAMDPDTRVSDGSDQNNVNIGALLKKGPVEYDLVYFRNLSGTDFSDDAVVSNKHQILLKILVTL